MYMIQQHIDMLWFFCRRSTYVDILQHDLLLICTAKPQRIDRSYQSYLAAAFTEDRGDSLRVRDVQSARSGRLGGAACLCAA